jgi:hypothetical protein
VGAPYIAYHKLLTSQNNDLTRLVVAYFFDRRRHTATGRVKMHWTTHVKIDETAREKT